MPFNFRKKHKFGAQRVETAGHSFASKLELSVYKILKLQEKAGSIEILKCQCEVRMTLADVIYKPDFQCKDLKTGKIFFVEAKGYETPEWRIKLRLWRYYGAGPLHIYKGHYNYPKLHEIITVKERVPIEDDLGNS